MRTIWILSEKTWSTVETGPHRRVRSLVDSALGAEHVVHVACPEWKSAAPDGCHPEILAPSLLDRIPIDDLLIASPFLPPRMIESILHSRHELHVDFYCVSALEGLESSHRYPFWRRALGRTRTWRRYMLLLARSSRFYLSTEAQLFFLAGSLYSRIGVRRDRWLSDLPRRAIIAPMGIPALPKTQPSNPYPPQLSSRPIFLWGGGIWEWLDAQFLIRSFAALPEPDTGPVLYFLAGTNPSGEASQDLAPRNAVQLAKELGVLGRNVWFHSQPVGPDDLPGFLSYCRAGIMANQENLESLASWRTRYLDLIPAKKPLLVHRPDPLAKRMASLGVAHIAGDADVRTFSLQILGFLQHFGLSAPPQWDSIGQELSDQNLLSQVRASWSEKHPTPPPPSLHSVVRWILGF